MRWLKLVLLRCKGLLNALSRQCFGLCRAAADLGAASSRRVVPFWSGMLAHEFVEIPSVSICIAYGSLAENEQIFSLSGWGFFRFAKALVVHVLRIVNRPIF